ncbi:glucose-6-phosphate dehydrogenase [Phenylobacterium sp.]|uniref:glucose-6-phosphate dehydrogenase n=1 Tax=Phenylobacterium sp. TaxID=1871053 RepID=UPI001219DE3A|nr:glucose-6-phosphate dehydrogenase [Phenylobacterium sp.]THD60212.1 MAG: glucose-6-phosphate dehydrogenase [Phenylobacterium sp.]
MARAAPKPQGLAPAPPCTLVVFGARGDLTKRLLTPALYNLTHERLLPDGFRVLGVDHNVEDDASFGQNVESFLRTLVGNAASEADEGGLDRGRWAWLRHRLGYLTGDFEDPATYRALAARLASDGGKGQGAIFYLATSPRFFGEIVRQLAKAGLTDETDGFRRVVIEKPFGQDLRSAKALNALLLKRMDEGQIYRIDHFMGKETVRNIMALRFANAVFEPIWNRDNIDHVQITAAETVGVEDRGGFYDQAGALRDMVPNHLFQLLGMVAMEPPNSLGAEAIRAEKARVIEAIEIQTPAQALANSVRGQYRAGQVGGKSLSDYRAAQNVAKTSHTETFVALKLSIDNWRWAGVPFYLRTGKAMAARDTEVVIRFKAPPGKLFREGGSPAPAANELVLQLQPQEGISLAFDVKQPGEDMSLAPVRMDFRYADYFTVESATGYEPLLYDVMIGDQTLFKKADEIEASWRAVQPFMTAWSKGGVLHSYAAGANGPPQADALLARDGRSWHEVGP